MIIQGPHGVDADLTVPTMDRIFAQVENGSTTAIPKGALCVWDLTDNRAVSGILADTFGLRVTISPTAYRTSAIFNKAGFASVAMDATPAATRGTIYPMQVYGPCNFVLVDTTAAGDTLAGGMAWQSNDTAGYVSGPEDNSVLANITDAERAKAVGFFRDVIAAGGSATTGTLFIKCLGVTG